MRRPAALFPILLALGAFVLAPVAGARVNTREEGPIEIAKCQTIDETGSYKLVNNLTFSRTDQILTCLLITADFVTINLNGFTISASGLGTTAIEAGSDRKGIAVRNGSISNFSFGVTLSGSGSVVEELHVFGATPSFLGIAATGIVKDNTAVGIFGIPGNPGVAISATGNVTGNYAIGYRGSGIQVGPGSTVIGNSATGFGLPFPNNIGLDVSCPSNVTNNTAVNNGINLVLSGNGCNDTNNVAP
jgi:hypothetical protein